MGSLCVMGLHVIIIIVREFVFCVSTQVGHNLFVEIFIYKKGPGSLYEACSRIVTIPPKPHFYMVKLGVIRDIYINIVCAFSLKHIYILQVLVTCFEPTKRNTTHFQTRQSFVQLQINMAV